MPYFAIRCSPHSPNIDGVLLWAQVHGGLLEHIFADLGSSQDLKRALLVQRLLSCLDASALIRYLCRSTAGNGHLWCLNLSSSLEALEQHHFVIWQFFILVFLWLLSGLSLALISSCSWAVKWSYISAIIPRFSWRVLIATLKEEFSLSLYSSLKLLSLSGAAAWDVLNLAVMVQAEYFLTFMAG